MAQKRGKITLPQVRAVERSLNMARGVAPTVMYQIESVRFKNRASSMVIHEGAWQVCTDEGYEGRCRVFQPGEYADLRGFDNRIASLKRVG